MNSFEGAPGTAIREASILKQLKHDNIITLCEVIYKPHRLILILEYIVSSFCFVYDVCGLCSSTTPILEKSTVTVKCDTTAQEVEKTWSYSDQRWSNFDAYFRSAI